MDGPGAFAPGPSIPFPGYKASQWGSSCATNRTDSWPCSRCSLPVLCRLRGPSASRKRGVRKLNACIGLIPALPADPDAINPNPGFGPTPTGPSSRRGPADGPEAGRLAECRTRQPPPDHAEPGRPLARSHAGSAPPQGTSRKPGKSRSARPTTTSSRRKTSSTSRSARPRSSTEQRRVLTRLAEGGVCIWVDWAADSATPNFALGEVDDTTANRPVTATPSSRTSTSRSSTGTR